MRKPVIQTVEARFCLGCKKRPDCQVDLTHEYANKLRCSYCANEKIRENKESWSSDQYKASGVVDSLLIRFRVKGCKEKLARLASKRGKPMSEVVEELIQKEKL